MRTTIQYLDALKKRLDLPSDYAAAKVLGVTRQAVSKYRNGQSVFDEATAARAAELLGIDPLEVISACKAESAPDAFMRKVWENAWGKATGAATTVAITVFIAGLAAAPSPARSAPVSAESATLYIMSNYMRIMMSDYFNRWLAGRSPMARPPIRTLCNQTLHVAIRHCPKLSATAPNKTVA